MILKNQGLKINYYKLKNKELVVSNTNLTLIKSSNNVLNKNQIRLINQFKKTKVKPGYRQKLKKQLKPERKK